MWSRFTIVVSNQGAGWGNQTHAVISDRTALGTDLYRTYHAGATSRRRTAVQLASFGPGCDGHPRRKRHRHLPGDGNRRGANHQHGLCDQRRGAGARHRLGGNDDGAVPVFLPTILRK